MSSYHNQAIAYRPEIDGLRAIAVLPVILFHAGFELFSGGYVGVDVFFVISGYLITSIILREMEQDKFSIVCVFWLKLDKVSRRNWTRIPFEPGHGFWLKLDKDSSANWTHQIARG